MIAGFTMLLAKVAAFAMWLIDLVVAVFVAVWDILRDAVCWCLDECMAVAVSTVGALDTSAFADVNAWGQLPAEVLNILALLGAGTAVSIIGAAIAIRLTLQLIPFTRLGS